MCVGGGHSPPSPSSLCAVQTVIDTQMAEVTALLCKWSLDQIQSRLHGGGWMFAIESRVGGRQLRLASFQEANSIMAYWHGC